MIPASRQLPLLRGGLIILVALSAWTVLHLTGRLTQVPARLTPDTDSQMADLPPLFASTDTLTQAPWNVLRSDNRSSTPSGSLAQRFRLAGTLFGFGVGTVERPQAILDDKVQVVQRLVKRGEEVLPGVRLIEVAADHVVFETTAGREELWIEGTAFSLADRNGAGSTGGGDETLPLTTGGHFDGGEVFPGRWEFRRDSLLNYYSELRDRPERLLAVFDSLEPLYQDNDPSTRTITGYTLNVKGEPQLFESMGINPGDIVRAVNSMPMTNRRRAEAFIRSFVENEEDTFVFEIERNGEMTKQVYIIR